jgi:hypothetical protein
MSETKPGGVWFNRRTIVLLELPFPHEFQTRSDGWRLDVVEGGKLLARFVDGQQRSFDLRPGDFLLASGEELYLSIRGASRGPYEHEERAGEQQPSTVS